MSTIKFDAGVTGDRIPADAKPMRTRRGDWRVAFNPTPGEKTALYE